MTKPLFGQPEPGISPEQREELLAQPNWENLAMVLLKRFNIKVYSEEEAIATMYRILGGGDSPRGGDSS